jgi:hypothetical protein
MKDLSRLLLALAAVLVLACTPTNAAPRVGRPMTGFGVWRSTRFAGTAVPCG